MRNDQSTRELPLLGGVLRQPAPVALSSIEAFGSDEEIAIRAAVIWAWAKRRVPDLTKATAAALCGITPQHFSLIVAGAKYLPPHKINAFEDIVGNTAVSQTIARFRALRDEEVREALAGAMAERMRKSA